MVTYALGQELKHLDLNIVGIVESEFPIRVHIANSPVREMVNVKVGDNDLVWWNVDRVVPLKPISQLAPVPEVVLTVPAPVPTLATL